MYYTLRWDRVSRVDNTRSAHQVQYVYDTSNDAQQRAIRRGGRMRGRVVYTIYTLRITVATLDPLVFCFSLSLE